MALILLIETLEESMAWLREAPELGECTFVTCHGGVEALREVARRPIDLLVTSPETPAREDLALVEAVRRVRPGVRTIILAPARTAADVIAALRARVFAFFGEPIDHDEVISMARKAVEVDDAYEGIEVESARPDWITLRVDCRRLTADRLVQFIGELRTDVEETERGPLLIAFREMLLNAMEHGAAFDPGKAIEVSAVRTDRAVVFYVRDPGDGFQPENLTHAAFANPPGDPLRHMAEREAKGMRPGGFGILIARQIVDEVIYSERGNEVLLIKHTD